MYVLTIQDEYERDKTFGIPQLFILTEMKNTINFIYFLHQFMTPTFL